MYQQIEPALRMTSNEASERYPDRFVIMRMDSMNPSNSMGTVLYVGDDSDELYSLIINFDDFSNCGVIEGTYHRCSLGGIVVGT